ncbi:MAG: ribosomal protein S18-alanine N-acetyltransferase [Bryobacteraceae bacterium]|nr:ribosomal protein S18-alanine N-acetyltransferase [Bryobacteraceae bacterium]
MTGMVESGEEEAGIAIRAAARADLPFIEQIQTLSPESAQWPAADFLNYDCRVALAGGRVAGFIVTRSAAGEHEILTLAVAPEFRRRGIGRALVESVLRSLAGPVFLEVRESNMAALNLYKTIGFYEYAVRRSYYSDPEEPAIVMRI